MPQSRAALSLAVIAVAVVAAGAALLSAEPPPSSSIKKDWSPIKKDGEPKDAKHDKRSAIGHAHHADVDAAVKLPRWWKAGDPVPIVKSNCVRCHLTAGRELTAPAQDFARSVHDLHGMTCSDCHGGNRDKDSSAHEEEFGFIGTKLSAHMAGCADCHSEQAEVIKASPHYWDFSKSVNLKYPVCSDCHGHHDVEKPPAEFALKTVCRECHLNLERDMPSLAAVVTENDRLWGVIRNVQERNLKHEHPVPEQFHRDLAAARHLTAGLIHPAHKITEQQADQLNAQVRTLRGRLEQWLADDAAKSKAQAKETSSSAKTKTDRSKDAP